MKANRIRIADTGTIAFTAIGQSRQFSVTTPQIPGTCLGLVFHVSASMHSAGGGGADCARRDFLRCVSVTPQDTAGHNYCSNMGLDDIEAIQQANGLSNSGIDGLHMAVGNGATVSKVFDVILPLVDKKKAGREKYDHCIDGRQVLQSLSMQLTAQQGSAVDVFCTSLRVETYALYTMDLPGHLGIRREWVTVDTTSPGVDLDTGSPLYQVARCLAAAPYVAGTDPVLTGYTTNNLTVDGRPLEVNIDVLNTSPMMRLISEDDLANLDPTDPLYDGSMYQHGIVPVNAATYLCLFEPTSGYSGADLLEGRIRADFAAIPATAHFVIERQYILDREEAVKREPLLRGLSDSQLNRVIKGAGAQSSKTAKSTPTVLRSLPGESIETTLKKVAQTNAGQ